MVYTGTTAPAPHGKFWYGIDDAGIQATGAALDTRLAQLGAQLANGTSVLVVMNTAASPMSYTLKASDGRTAAMNIPGHGIQTLRWD